MLVTANGYAQDLTIVLVHIQRIDAKARLPPASLSLLVTRLGQIGLGGATASSSQLDTFQGNDRLDEH
jgi:hypothetical protein